MDNYYGITIKEKYQLKNIDVLLGENEIIVKFPSTVSYINVFKVLHFFIRKNDNLLCGFTLYYNQSLQVSRIKIKKEILKNITPMHVLSFIESSENELTYNRNTPISSYFELIGFELRYEDPIKNWIDFEEDAPKIHRLLGKEGFYNDTTKT